MIRGFETDLLSASYHNNTLALTFADQRRAHEATEAEAVRRLYERGVWSGAPLSAAASEVAPMQQRGGSARATHELARLSLHVRLHHCQSRTRVGDLLHAARVLGWIGVHGVEH